MGARGPRPTPTSILEARGSRRATRNKSEPRPAKGRPACPEWLSAETKLVWDQVSEKLEQMGVLTTADGGALERYCTMIVQWRQCQAFLAKHGAVYPIKSGTGVTKCLAPFPQVAIAARLSLALTRLEAEFGLTPSSRTRVQVDVGTGVPDESEWLKDLLAPFDHLLKG